MEQYTASNGLIIKRRPNNGGFNVSQRDDFDLGLITGVTPSQADALREFFRAEEDERLARWRWPENPDLVVYVIGDSNDVVNVFNDSNGMSGTFSRDIVTASLLGAPLETANPNYSRAARAFFDVHPEAKPWHNAKAGDIWVLTIDGDTEPYQAVDDTDGILSAGIRWFPTQRYLGEWEPGKFQSEVVDGHRIWPEGDPS